MNNVQPMPNQVIKGKAWGYEKVLFTVYRLVILVGVFSVFFPELNPGRVTDAISKNVSLFTESISYSSIIANITRILMRGWVDNSIFILLQVFSALTLIGIILAAVGAGMSFGNRKMKFVGQIFPLAGAVFMSGGLVGLYYGYLNISALNNVKIAPMMPSGFWFYVVLCALIVVLSVLVVLDNQAHAKEKAEEKGMKMEEKYNTTFPIA